MGGKKSETIGGSSYGMDWKPSGSFDVKIGSGGRVIIPGQREETFRPGEQLMRRGQSKIEIKRGKGR